VCLLILLLPTIASDVYDENSPAEEEVEKTRTSLPSASFQHGIKRGDALLSNVM
jgi:hypothetical protein